MMTTSKTPDSINASARDRPIDGIVMSGDARATFAFIIALIDLGCISKFASAVRQSGHESLADNLAWATPTLSFIPCKVNPAPFSGFYNIVFEIEFADAVFWMLKIPANGYGQHFDEIASKALVSEARTMQMIKKATTIPVPGVYAFDASLNNQLQVPFILMQRIDGTPLYKGWFNQDGRSKSQLEKFRARALQSLAAAMAQLNRFMLDDGGSIVFDSDGKAVNLGGTKVLDANAMWYPENEDPDKSDIFCEKGPFTDPKSALLFMLNRRPSRPENDAYLNGIDTMLRMMIEWAYEKETRGPRFVLSHPDFDIQNILVAEDGTLRGLIDWDGVAAVPREVGCAQFPIWLMNDWIETQYDYDVSAGKPRDEAGYDESSPNELSCYRAMYAQFMEQEIVFNTKGLAHLTIQGTTPKEEADVTRRSLMMKNLEIATNTPMVTADIVDHMLAMIVDLTKADWDDGQPDCDSSSSTASEIETRVVEHNDERDNATMEHALDTSSSQGETCGGSDEGGTNIKATEADGEDQVMVANVSVHQFDEKVVNVETPVYEPSHLNEVETQEQEKGFSTDNFRNESDSAFLGWTRRLLRFGCNTAEKGLRRIAKIVHVPAVHEVADGLKAQNADFAMQGESGQMLESEHSQEAIDLECRQNRESEEPKGIPIAPETRDPEQAMNIFSIQGTEASRQSAERSAIHPTVMFGEISTRNFDLIKEAKAQKKVAKRVEIKAGTEDKEMWDRSAVEVRNCGVPVETLQKHEFEIASCVIDTVINALKAEQKQEQDMAASTSVAARMEKSSTSDAEPSSLAGHLVIGGHDTLTDDRVAESPIRVTGLQSSSGKTASRLQDLCRFGTSYFQRIFYSPNLSDKDIRGVSPDSSAHSEDEDVQSGDDETFRSSVTSLDEDEVDNESKEKDGPVNSFSRSKSYDLCLVEFLDTTEINKATRSGTVSVVGEEAGDVDPAGENAAQNDNESEANNEDGAEEDEDKDDASFTDEDGDTSQQEADFIDHGGFDTWTIINVLGKGELDELLMLRLKEGFFKLLEQC